MAAAAAQRLTGGTYHQVTITFNNATGGPASFRFAYSRANGDIADAAAAAKGKKLAIVFLNDNGASTTIPNPYGSSPATISAPESLTAANTQLVAGGRRGEPEHGRRAQHHQPGADAVDRQRQVRARDVVLRRGGRHLDGPAAARPGRPERPHRHHLARERHRHDLGLQRDRAAVPRRHHRPPPGAPERRDRAGPPTRPRASTTATGSSTRRASPRCSRSAGACPTPASPTRACAWPGHATAACDVSLRVTNTGPVAGSAVPQVYLGAPGQQPAGIQFAVRQLSQFARVTLQPGQSQPVSHERAAAPAAVLVVGRSSSGSRRRAAGPSTSATPTRCPACRCRPR